MNAIPPKLNRTSTLAEEAWPDGSTHEDRPPFAEAGADMGEFLAASGILPESDVAGDNGEDAGETRRRPAGNAAERMAIPAHLSSLEVTLSVEVGSQRLSLRELLAVEPDQLFALDRMTTEPVDILVNGRRFAQGEVVAIGERYGVRLTALTGPRD